MIHASRLQKSPSTAAQATVRMPGTCGELVQGRIDGVRFHVSCPIDIFSEVTVELVEGGDVWSFPPDTPKAARAARATLRHLGLRGYGGRLSIRSSLQRGKGMGSSTADVAGAIHAICAAADRAASTDEVADLALGVEPTDGSFLPGIALFDHRAGLIREPLGPPPPIGIVALDFGGEVDTLEFNARNHEKELIQLEPRFATALELVRKGLATGDVSLIGRAATLSALANQAILPKPRLPDVLAFAERIGALGVNVGHSGTVIGVLLDPSHHDLPTVESQLRREFPDLCRTWRCRLIGGGVQLQSMPGLAAG